YFQGEPYLNPEFLNLIRYATDKGLYTATSTNGHYLTDEMARKTVESGLDRLIISLDGTTQEVYEQYRKGGQLDKVIAGARNIVYWKKKLKSRTPFIFFQFLVVRPNEHQIEAAKRLALEIGVDQVRFKTAQINDYANDPHQLIPTLSRYSRYTRNQQGQRVLKNQLVNHCWRLWHAPVITWDGWMVPCCFDKDAEHRMGNLQQSSFRDIWTNPSYQNFRTQVRTGRGQIPICSNCSEGLQVWEGG
ncbi:MAG: radical SAM/SPASM domain-containing protein, partial [Chitinophagaceae bacterium]